MTSSFLLKNKVVRSTGDDSPPISDAESPFRKEQVERTTTITTQDNNKELSPMRIELEEESYDPTTPTSGDNHLLRSPPFHHHSIHHHHSSSFVILLNKTLI
jgi:hypothetical protein